MKVLYSGVDAFYVAFKGRIGSTTRDKLRAAKKAAGEAGASQAITIGGLDFHVMQTGAQGGYAFRLDGGPMGVKYLIKDNGDPEQWNIYAQARAEHLATVSLDELQIKMLDDLKAMGGYILGEAVSRLDYAVDLDAPDFRIDPALVIAHSKTHVSPYYETDETAQSDLQIGLSGRRVTSLTVGKMPGRQVQIYDKRREAIAKRKSFWFDIWKRKKTDKRGIWRVEIRLGKKHLKEHYGIDSFASLNASFYDLIKAALENVRYVKKVNEHNPELSPLSALWKAVRGVLDKRLHLHSNGLERGRMKQILKSERMAILRAHTEGLFASMCAVLDDGINKGQYETNEQAQQVRRGVFTRYLNQISRGLIGGRGWKDFQHRIEKSASKVLFLDSFQGPEFHFRGAK